MTVYLYNLRRSFTPKLHTAWTSFNSLQIVLDVVMTARALPGVRRNPAGTEFMVFMVLGWRV